MSTTRHALAQAFQRGREAGTACAGLDTLDAAAIEAAVSAVLAAAPASPAAAPLEALTVSHHLGRYAADQDALGSARAADWALVVGCLGGASGAIAELDRRLRESARPALRRLRMAEDAVDELQARFLALAVVGTETRPPLLLKYGGKGELLGWLRVAVVREGLRELRQAKGRRDESLDLAEGLAAGAADQDRAFQSELYGPHFRAAFDEALQALGPADRLLLAQHHVDGLSIDRLAELRGVHRATTARWVAAAREKLVAETRRRFRARTELDRSACESVLRLLREDFDVTLRRVLGG